MTHRSSGIYGLLERSSIYEFGQRILGGGAGRRRFVREFVRPEPGARILDIGCGSGAILDALPDGVAYRGYDLNPKYIAAAQRRYAARGEFRQARFEAVAEEPESFDLVLAMALLHHLNDDQAALLVEIAWRALRPWGTFVTVDPVRHDGQPWLARLLVSLDRGGNVRSADGYRALAGLRFDEVETSLVTDFGAVPYSHFVMRMKKTGRGV